MEFEYREDKSSTGVFRYIDFPKEAKPGSIPAISVIEALQRATEGLDNPSIEVSGDEDGSAEIVVSVYNWPQIRKNQVRYLADMQFGREFMYRFLPKEVKKWKKKFPHTKRRETYLGYGDEDAVELVKTMFERLKKREGLKQKLIETYSTDGDFWHKTTQDLMNG